MVIHTNTQRKKIMQIISTNLMKGPQVCADRLNHGNFPGPGSNGRAVDWEPEQILPYFTSKPVPVKKRKRTFHNNICVWVTKDMYWMLSGKGNMAAFVREAIDEKIARME